MTIGPRPQCMACRHLRPRTMEDFFSSAPFRCDAFPDAIPDAIFGGEADHRQPFDGDHGIHFEAKAGDEFPEHSLVRDLR